MLERQQDNFELSRNIEELKTRIMSQPTIKEDVGVSCQIPTKYKTKVKYHRKKQFLEESKSK